MASCSSGSLSPAVSLRCCHIARGIAESKRQTVRKRAAGCGLRADIWQALARRGASLLRLLAASCQLPTSSLRLDFLSCLPCPAVSSGITMLPVAHLARPTGVTHQRLKACLRGSQAAASRSQQALTPTGAARARGLARRSCASRPRLARLNIPAHKTNGKNDSKLDGSRATHKESSFRMAKQAFSTREAPLQRFIRLALYRGPSHSSYSRIGILAALQFPRTSICSYLGGQFIPVSDLSRFHKRQSIRPPRPAPGQLRVRAESGVL